MPDWRSFMPSGAPDTRKVVRRWEKARGDFRDRPEPEPEPTPEPTYYTRLEIFEAVKDYIDAYKKGEADITDFVKLSGRVGPNDKAFAQMAIDVVDAYAHGKGKIADFVRLAAAAREPTGYRPPPDVPPIDAPPEAEENWPGRINPPDVPPIDAPPPLSATGEAKWTKYPFRRGLGSYPRPAQPSIPTPKPEYETPGRPKKRADYLNPFAWKKARNRLWWK